jgi:hypothetical protein
MVVNWPKVKAPMMGAAQPESASPTAIMAQIRAIAPFMAPLNAAYVLCAADENDALAGLMSQKKKDVSCEM